MRRLWKILIGVATALAVLLALNTISVDNDTKPAKQTVPGARILHLADGDIQVKVDGPATAPPIVLVHCWTCSLRYWDKVTPLLAKDHRVIRMDLLGHGGSQKPSSGYSIPNQAQIVAETMSALGVQQATVVGHSMGAAVVTALAQQSPKLVNGVVIMDLGPSNNFNRTHLDEKASLAPGLGQLMWRLTPRFVWRHGQGSAEFASGVDFPQAFTDDLRDMTYTAYKRTYEDTDDYRSQQPLDERLKPLGLPLLVLWGAKDKNQKAAGAEAYRIVPGAEVHVMEGSGHTPQWEEPQETAALIEAFVKPIDAGFLKRQAQAKKAAAAAAAKKRAAAKKKASAARAKARRKAQAVARRAKR